MDKRKKELGLISYLFLQSGGHMWSDIIHNSENSRRKEGRKKAGRGEITSYILYNLSIWLHLFLVMGGRGIQGLVLKLDIKISQFLLVKVGL